MKTKTMPRVVSFEWTDIRGPMLGLLRELGAIFKVRDASVPRKLAPDERAARMMIALVQCSLANIEQTAPAFDAAIRYCEKEGINLGQYFESQIALKFKRKHHRKSLHLNAGAGE